MGFDVDFQSKILDEIWVFYGECRLFAHVHKCGRVKRQFGVVPALIVFNRIVKPLTVAVSVEQNLI
jgi:hypothetical protein